MAERTAISWTDSTVNFWWGCTKVGPGCDHCYAETWSKRAGHNIWGVGAPRNRIGSASQTLRRLNDGHAVFLADTGRRRRVFVQSMSDLFDLEVPQDWFGFAWGRLAESAHLDVQIVTKRLAAVEKRLSAIAAGIWPPHAGLIATIVNQMEADRDIPRLIALKKSRRIPWIGLSMEPLLGAVVLRPEWLAEIDWIIVGGESGAHARPMHPAWARGIRDACAAAGVPFHFKQWGHWAPHGDLAMGSIMLETDGQRRPVNMDLLALGDDERAAMPFQPVMMRPLGKDRTGRELDGATHDEFPRIAA